MEGLQTTGAKLRLPDGERTALVRRLWPDITRLATPVPHIDITRWTLEYAPDDSLEAPVRQDPSNYESPTY